MTVTYFQHSQPSFTKCGQRVRQQPARNIRTKDSVGILPLNCHESEKTDPKTVDFAELAQVEQAFALEEEISPCKSTASEVLISGETVVCVSKGYQHRMQSPPSYLAIVNENLAAYLQGRLQQR